MDRYLLETGSMRKALGLAQDTEAFCDAQTRDGLVKRSYLYNTYGVVKLQHQDNVAAGEWFQKAYQIRRQHLGETDANTVAVRGNLMLVLLGEERYSEIVDTLTPVRDLLTTALSHIPIRMTSTIFDQLAMAFFYLGRYDEAWDHIQESVRLSKDTQPMYSQGSG